MTNLAEHPRRLLSRRGFLFGSALLGGSLAAKLAFEKIPVHTLLDRMYIVGSEINADWKEACRPVDEFWKRHEERLSLLSLGCSFSQEYWSEQTDIPPEVAVGEFAKLGIKEVRFGMAWNMVESDRGIIDFSYYDKTLRALMDEGINITLNLGPIKTNRWPEEKTPDYLAEEIELHPKNGRVTPDCPLALAAYDYLHRFCQHLIKQYTPEQLSRITMINPENEAISPPFGRYGWTIDPEYLRNIIKITSQYFPSIPILLNTAGTTESPFAEPTFGEAVPFASSLRDQGSLPVTVGLDYYYMHPQSLYLPFVSQRLDPFSQFTILKGPKYLEKMKTELAKKGNKTEVTELQMEPWDNFISPGQSPEELRYAILRCLRFLPVDSQSVMRIWGIEHLIRAMLTEDISPGQREIIKMIQKVNKR